VSHESLRFFDAPSGDFHLLHVGDLVQVLRRPIEGEVVALEQVPRLDRLSHSAAEIFKDQLVKRLKDFEQCWGHVQARRSLARGG